MGKRKLTLLEKVLLVNGGFKNRLRQNYRIKPMKRRGKDDD